MKLARALVSAAAVCAAAAVAAQPAMAATAHGEGNQVSSQAAFHLPYTDPQQAGWLTLCGTNLKPITHGSITAKPFVWRVVSDIPAPNGYFIKGAKAQLFTYQPRPYTPPGAWSGTLMGAASLYSNRAHPMAQFTPIDEPLTYMTLDFAPIWDHLLQLRLYLGAPDRPEYTTGYAAADIQVEGNSWTLVAGGHAACTSGQVVSEETLVGMPGASGTPKPQQAGAAKAGTASPSAGSRGSTAKSSGSGPGSSGSGGSRSAGVATAAHTSSAVPIAAGLGAGVLIVALLSSAVIVRRRRRITG